MAAATLGCRYDTTCCAGTQCRDAETQGHTTTSTSRMPPNKTSVALLTTLLLQLVEDKTPSVLRSRTLYSSYDAQVLASTSATANRTVCTCIPRLGIPPRL